MSIELLSARLLRFGAILAAVLIATGVLMQSAGQGTEFITAGLIVLLLTPILRVVVALWVFLQERDFIFALFSLLVLLALGGGIWIGKSY